MKIHAGASGFSYKPWKGPFYPADLPDGEMLGYYAGRLPAVEINNTFYHMPKAATLEGWAEKTPPGFRFALKAARQITHFKRLKDPAEPVAYFLANAATLGPKLGPILFQLPPNMKKDLERLEAFLAVLPDDQRATFEFRHPSWFEEDVFAALRTRGAALCVAETDDDDKTAPPVATADWGYLRLRRAAYVDADLQRWAGWIAAQSWTEAFVFFKHEDSGMAPQLAERLMAMVAS